MRKGLALVAIVLSLIIVWLKEPQLVGPIIALFWGNSVLAESQFAANGVSTKEK